MALQKAVTMPNGLVLNYHRIALLSIDVNNRTTILVLSYPTEQSREYEKAYARSEIHGEPNFPYVYSDYITVPYDENTNIKSAYALLKTFPEFEGAIDVFEEPDNSSANEMTDI